MKNTNGFQKTILIIKKEFRKRYLKTFDEPIANPTTTSRMPSLLASSILMADSVLKESKLLDQISLDDNFSHELLNFTKISSNINIISLVTFIAMIYFSGNLIHRLKHSEYK